MGDRSFVDGNVTVTLSDALDNLVEAAEDDVPGAVLEALQVTVGEVHDDALRGWPVVTGRSRAGLVTVSETDGNTISVAERNDVPYAPFIVPKAYHGATTAWQRLVRGPIYARRTRVLEVLGVNIVRALRRGR